MCTGDVRLEPADRIIVSEIVIRLAGELLLIVGLATERPSCAYSSPSFPVH